MMGIFSWLRKDTPKTEPKPEPKEMYFRATKHFEAEVNGRWNVYCGGMTYAARPGPQWDDLREKSQQWAREGKISFIAAPGSFVRGNH